MICCFIYFQKQCHYIAEIVIWFFSVFRSSATIAGIVIGSLFGLAVLIAIIVVIVKTVTRSTGSHGRIVQPTITSGDATTITYSTPTTPYGK